MFSIMYAFMETIRWLEMYNLCNYLSSQYLDFRFFLLFFFFVRLLMNKLFEINQKLNI